MKRGMTITIADMENLLKEELCKISCLDFRILMVLDKSKKLFLAIVCYWNSNRLVFRKKF